MHRIRWKPELTIDFQRLIWFSPTIFLLANYMPHHWDTFGPDIRALLVSTFFVAHNGER